MYIYVFVKTNESGYIFAQKITKKRNKKICSAHIFYGEIRGSQKFSAKIGCPARISLRNKGPAKIYLIFWGKFLRAPYFAICKSRGPEKWGEFLRGTPVGEIFTERPLLSVIFHTCLRQRIWSGSGLITGVQIEWYITGNASIQVREWVTGVQVEWLVIKTGVKVEWLNFPKMLSFIVKNADFAIFCKNKKNDFPPSILRFEGVWYFFILSNHRFYWSSGRTNGPEYLAILDTPEDEKIPHKVKLIDRESYIVVDPYENASIECENRHRSAKGCFAKKNPRGCSAKKNRFAVNFAK